jgi:antitoxin ParD1/3/4
MVTNMTMIKKSITVTDQQDNWIKSQIETGHYGNESEIIRELIRERQLREKESDTEIEAIREKLIAAEQSGFSEQSPEEIFQEIKSGLGRHAKL